jgi:peroxiredoxin
MSEKIELKVGDTALDFTLDSNLDKKITLSDYRGRKNVVLAFHPLAWTSVCANEMKAFEAEIARFAKAAAQVLGISVDSAPCKKAWAESLQVKCFPMLADFWPHGAVAKSYGIFREAEGTSKRATFIVDKEGVIRYKKIHPSGELPDLEELLDVLKGV